MKNSDFYLLVDEFLDECIQTMKSKGDTYAGASQDKFANFKRLAAKLSLHEFKILMVYMQKHLDAIDAFVREEYNDPEPIDGRIKDAINYLLILYGMIIESKDALIKENVFRREDIFK